MVTLKLALAAGGLAVFWLGVRADNNKWRWAGIGAVGVAFALRFVDRRGPSGGAPS